MIDMPTTCPEDWGLTYTGPSPSAQLTVDITHADGRVETMTVNVGEQLALPPGVVSYRWNS